MVDGARERDLAMPVSDRPGGFLAIIFRMERARVSDCTCPVRTGFVLIESVIVISVNSIM